METSLQNLIDFSDDTKDTVKLDGVIAEWKDKKVSEVPYKLLISEMLKVLPKDKDKVNMFSTCVRNSPQMAKAQQQSSGLTGGIVSMIHLA